MSSPDLFGHLVTAIERAKAARQSDYTLSNPPVTGRILVTGSRTWTNTAQLGFQLRVACARYLPSAIVIVHGACPNGADRYAEMWAKQHGLRTEPHPANWRPNGIFDRAAGFKRNAEMVALGADICLAFIHNQSAGATHTADLAEKAGIPVRRFTDGAATAPSTTKRGL